MNLIFWRRVKSSSSAWRRIIATTPAFDVGLSTLSGCTALIVYSPNGVYGAHFFEDQAWGSGHANFQEFVVDFLQNGRDGFPGLAGDIAGTLRWIQSRPGLVPGQAEYHGHINELVQELIQIIPRLQNRVQVSLYEALDGGTNEDGSNINEEQHYLLDYTARGRVLFQYDPKNYGQRSARLFFETTLVFSQNLGRS